MSISINKQGETGLNDEQIIDTFDNLEFIKTKRISEKIKQLDDEYSADFDVYQKKE